MKNIGRGIQKALSVLFAMVIVGSCFACSASAEESKSFLQTMSDSFNQALVTATANPTPQTPLTYSYTTTIYARDMYGRTSDRPTTVCFYASKDAYEKGAEPIFSQRIGSSNSWESSCFEKGKATVTYTDLFSQKPPATLYFVVDPQPDTVYSPMSGTVYAQYAG